MVPEAAACKTMRTRSACYPAHVRNERTRTRWGGLHARGSREPLCRLCVPKRADVTSRCESSSFWLRFSTALLIIYLNSKGTLCLSAVVPTFHQIQVGTWRAHTHTTRGRGNEWREREITEERERYRLSGTRKPYYSYYTLEPRFTTFVQGMPRPLWKTCDCVQETDCGRVRYSTWRQRLDKVPRESHCTQGCGRAAVEPSCW